MSIKPILFNSEMVRAILDGRKTQTRRLMKPQPLFYTGRKYIFADEEIPKKWEGCQDIVATYQYQPGDILWVRETWQHVYTFDDSDKAIEETGRYVYFSDDPMPFTYWVDTDTGEHRDQMPWRPSIHMPREAARIFLRVTDVRVERLQDITEDDVCSEGAEPIIRCNRQHPVYDRNGVPGDMCWNTNSACKDCPEFKSYAELFGEDVWNETIKKSDMDKYGWSANPWVWVIKFERCEKPTDESARLRKGS